MENKSGRKKAAWALVVIVTCLVILIGTLYFVGLLPSALDIILSVAKFFYTPWLIILLVSLALEFVILKSADRSRLLQIELDKLRVKRQAEISIMRQAHESLEDSCEKIGAGVSLAEVIVVVSEVLDSLRPPEAKFLGGADEK